MAKNKRKSQPTELELLILKVLWRSDESDLPMPVREIRQGLEGFGRVLAHTSVITTLNVMVEKKFLKRSKRKNAFLFAPIVAEDEVQSNAIGDLLNKVFDGSAQSLMSALLGRADVDDEDLDQINKMINRKRREQ